MRTLLPLLLFIVVGCNHCPRFLDCTSCGKEVIDCPNECSDCKHRPRNKPCDVKCEQTPEIEVKAPKPIHVKIPPQKIVVQNETQPQAMMQPQSFAPQSFAPQSAPQQMVMMPVMQPQSAGPAGRARPGLTFDVFRLPIPFPRLIAVPEAPPAMQAVAVQSYAPQSFAPQSFAPQSAPVQQHAMVAMPGTVEVPVQTMVRVPYQAQMPVPVQPQSFAPQSFAPQSAAVQPQRMIPVVPQSGTFQPQSCVPPQMQGISMQQAEEFCRLVEQMKKQMNECK